VRTLPGVFPLSFNSPPTNRRRTLTDRASRSTSERCRPIHSSGRRPGADRENGDRRITWVELVGDGVDLLPGLERRYLAPLVPVPPWVPDPVGRVPLDEAAGDAPRDRLPEDAEDAVT
jgi:hypothetical protein